MAEKLKDPYEVVHAALADGTKIIEIILPLNYLNGCMRFVMRYRIQEDEEGRNAIIPISTQVSTHYDQDLRGAEEQVEFNRINISLHEEMDTNFLFVMRYLRFAKKYIQNYYEDPPSFRMFCNTAKSQSLRYR